jgi:small ligand-binding sensory domain FIST
MHGCRPAGGYHTITRAEGPAVIEIDGKPALEVISQLLGPESDKDWEDYPLFVTLGVNKGDKFGLFREEDYANRLVMAVDKARGALVMFEDDLKAGFDIQLMRRSIDFTYVGRRANDLLARVVERSPFFALYIDCAGRASAYCGTEREEAEEVQRVMQPRLPLLGMYSGVEIAKVGPDMQALDWTGVLCVFSE